MPGKAVPSSGPTIGDGAPAARLFAEALDLHQAGRLDEAERRYRQLLAVDPRHADALHYLGLVRHQAGQHDDAVRLIRESLAARATPEAYSNLGTVLAALGRHDEAESALRSALALAPGHADAAFNLGNVLGARERYAAAEAAYRQAVAAAPRHFAALNNLGNVLQLQGRADAAAEAFMHLGDLLQSEGRTQDAANAYRQAYTLAPGRGVEVKLALLVPVIPGSAAEIDASRARILKALAALEARGLKLPDPRNDRELRAAIAKFYLGACPRLGWRAPHCEDYAGPGAKIRVGFVSKYLRADHPIGKYYATIMERLDRARFDVVAFRFAAATGAQAAGDTSTLLTDDLEAARQAIAHARLDVLFYPDVGMEPTTYFLAMARLAPVQLASLGHPVTTGIPNVDYFLSAADLEPEGAELRYSETLIRLAQTPTYFVARTAPGAAPSRAELGIPPGAVVYACGQNPIKIHPEFDAVLGEVLRRDRAGVLVLFNGERTPLWEQLLRQRFARSIPDVADRIVFLPFLELAAYLGVLAAADAVLDTPPFGGGTTSLEMFAAGIPIVVWPGADARSRQTYAAYRQMEIDGLAASSAETFVALALRLAHDRAWHADVQARLRERSDRLFENAGVVREMERMFEAAVAAAAQGRKLERWPLAAC